jgi:hypothetical protein
MIDVGFQRYFSGQKGFYGQKIEILKQGNNELSNMIPLTAK